MIPNSSNAELRALRLALELAAARDSSLSWAILNDHFGSDAALLISMGLLKPNGHVATIETRDSTLATVIWSDERGGPGYFNDGDGWVDLRPEEVGVFSLQIPELINCVTERLDLRPSGALRELVPSLVWELGFARLPGQTKRVSIWVARRLHDPDVWEALRETARNRPTLDLRLIISLSNSETPDWNLVNQVVASVASLVSVMDPLRIDAGIASARLRLPVGRADGVRLSAEGGHLIVRGRDYVFGGLRQRAIVRQLWEARASGDARLLTENVLLEAQCGATVRRLANVFKGHPNWHEVIKEEAGFCWLEA